MTSMLSLLSLLCGQYINKVTRYSRLTALFTNNTFCFKGKVENFASASQIYREQILCQRKPNNVKCQLKNRATRASKRSG